MKKIFLFILFIYSNPISSNAQWISQPIGTLENIWDIEFINGNTGWACGEGSTILKTTNGGMNWVHQQASISNEILTGIHPVNENIIYCVGYFRAVMKTTNGGSNWFTLQNNNPWNSYFGVYFLNKDTGFISGALTYVYKTTNGGITFDSISNGSSYKRDFYFKNDMEGLIVGDGAIVNKTTNGGQNWSNILIKPIFENFRRISCFNDTCFVVGNEFKVYRTINFGNTWDSVGYVNGADEIYCSKFTSTKIGYAGGSFGRLFKTTDGGGSWLQQNTNNEPGFFLSIYGYSDSVVWVCGGSVNGRILYTETGGETLVSVSQSGNNLPNNFKLNQNYPNPFNAQTLIEFDITTKGNYKFEVYSILGEKMLEGFDKEFSPGSYSVNLNMNSFSSGIYIYRVTGNGISLSKTLMLVK